MRDSYDVFIWDRDGSVNKRLVLIIIIVSSLQLSGCEIYDREEKKLISFIESFFDTQYEAYVNLDYIDIEPFLDMSRIQNKNKVTALKKLIIQRKHIEEMNYAIVNKNKYPFEIIVKDMNINGEYASVTVELDLDESKDYPRFISKGLNNFVLKMEDGKWEIVNHDYEGLVWFESSITRELPERDEEWIRKAVDNEYGKSPFS